MTLRNSFLASLKENNKRRIWLWIVSMLFWFFYYPVGTAMLISRTKNNNLFMRISEEAARENLTEVVRRWFEANEVIMVCIILFAVVSAIQGFSYLYSRKKVDLYHSVPVEKLRRFTVIGINSVLIFCVPYVINLLMAMLVAGINGGMTGANAGIAFFSLLVNVLLYLGVYGLTLIAVMMTGNMVVTLFATAVFMLYELAVRVLLANYQYEFFRFYSHHAANYTPFLSPFGSYINVMDNIRTYGSNMSIGQTMGASMPSVIKLVLLAIAFLAAAYFCYRKRPSEAAGRTMAFPKTKAVVKFLLVVPFTLVVDALVKDMLGSGYDGKSSGTVAFIIFGMLAAVILGNCVIEVIYELDIRAAFHKKYQILISGVCVVIIYCVFLFDLTGFDRWTPNPDKLKEAVIVIQNENYWKNHLDENLNYMSPEDYCSEQSGITDINAICELSEKKGNIDNADALISCEVEYRMKNGKTVWRNFQVAATEEDTLNKIISNKEYKETTYQIYDEALFDKIKQENSYKITYNTGISIENLAPEDIDIIRSLYLKDMENFSYTTLRDELQCGKISFVVRERNDNADTTLNFDVYPSYENITGYLREKGVYREQIVDPGEISSISVTNFHNELYGQEGYSAEHNLARGTAVQSITKTFMEYDQIEELVQALYPAGFGSEWLAPEVISGNYYVTVQLKNSTANSAYYRGDNGFSFITDRIPEWVEKETAYE